MELQPRIGGSFAPPLSDELIAKYTHMVDDLPPSPVKDGMSVLLHCCGVWWDLPESNGTKQPHGSGTGTITNLEDDHKKALWDHIPWDHELNSIQALFDTIDPETQRDLRNAAFHLLWHVKELNLDREPLTTDKL